MESELPSNLVHDARRLEFGNPKELEYLIRKYPLDTKFIDWFSAKGGRVIYRHDWKAGDGVWSPPKLIFLGVRGKGKLVDLALCHELVHAAVPDQRLGVFGYMVCRSRNEHGVYEHVIDSLAEEYAFDRVFLNYAKNNISSVLR